MIVVIANDLPPAVRGRMKLWFIEPKPNVFVAGVKDAVAKKVIDDITQYCPAESGLLIIYSTPKPPWYRIIGLGDTNKPRIDISGLPLILEKMMDANPPPT